VNVLVEEGISPHNSGKIPIDTKPSLRVRMMAYKIIGTIVPNSIPDENGILLQEIALLFHIKILNIYTKIWNYGGLSHNVMELLKHSRLLRRVSRYLHPHLC
jgi:hypothetical protein